MSESLEFEKTNFGFLAVRVAKSISAVFGGGILTGSEGAQTERNLFERSARWIDYSGPTNREGNQIEGITYFDHPSNPGQPTGWHVRGDGWLCASPCIKTSITTSEQEPLALRYLLHIHSGTINSELANNIHSEFSARLSMQVLKGTKPHTRWQIERRE